MANFANHGRASDFEDWANGCRGKVGYPFKRIANGAVRVLKRDFPQDRTNARLNAYSCGACGRYHVGHRPGRAANV